MVQAAPNKAPVKFEVLKKWQSEDFPNKIELKVKLLPLEGQPEERFLKVGQTYKGFTFEQGEGLEIGRIYEAEGEYIGGPNNGTVQLSKIARLND